MEALALIYCEEGLPEGKKWRKLWTAVPVAFCSPVRDALARNVFPCTSRQRPSAATAREVPDCAASKPLRLHHLSHFNFSCKTLELQARGSLRPYCSAGSQADVNETHQCMKFLVSAKKKKVIRYSRRTLVQGQVACAVFPCPYKAISSMIFMTSRLKTRTASQAPGRIAFQNSNFPARQALHLLTNDERDRGMALEDWTPLGWITRNLRGKASSGAKKSPSGDPRRSQTSCNLCLLPGDVPPGASPSPSYDFVRA